MTHEEKVTKFTDTQYAIIQQIITAVDKLGGKSDVVAPIASWGDTLSDEDVLTQLMEYNNR